MPRLFRKKIKPLSSYNADCYTTSGWGYKKKPYRKKLFLQFVISLVIALAALNIIGSHSSLGKKLEGYMKYLMTKEINFRPVFQKVVDFSLRAKNFDWPSLNDSYVPPTVTVSGQTDKELMSLPVSGQIIRSYGWVKSDIDNAARFHDGIDIKAPAGTEVKSALAGRVIKLGSDRELGRYMIIEHAKNLKTLYAHISGEKVKAQDTVRDGQAIARIAKSVDGEIAHLHFEVRINDKLVDPMDSLKFDKK